MPRAGGAPPERSRSLTEALRGFFRALKPRRNGESTLRETLEELIEEHEDGATTVDSGQRELLANILEARGQTVEDVMVPRADIVAIRSEVPLAEVIDTMIRVGHSRLPVYRRTLDDAIGMVHIKDVLAWRGRDAEFRLGKLLRKLLFVAPSMGVLELLLEMRVTRTHLALVVDEFGGVDGLVTIEDLVEEIVGDIEDEHTRAPEPQIVRREDQSIDADARMPLEELEEAMGPFFTAAELDEIDTLGGLIVSLAGRVPIRGELVAHSSGLEFEVLDADPRRVKRVRIRGIGTATRRAPED